MKFILIMLVALLFAYQGKADRLQDFSKDVSFIAEPTESQKERHSPKQPFDETLVERSAMPRIDITTDNGRMITGDQYEQPVFHSSIKVSNCNLEYAVSGLTADVRVRGNSTAVAAKKPYKIKFDEKQPLLGLNNGKKFKSWCLLADYYDVSMMRNWTAFSLGQTLLDGKWYSSDYTHVEVYINGEYQGVYLLCEQTQIKKNRIAITEKEEDDLTTLQTGYVLVGQGGIWWEENYIDIPIGFDVSDRNGDSNFYEDIRFVIQGGDHYSEEQRQYIAKYVSAAFMVMKSAIYDGVYYTLDRDGNISVNTKLTRDSTKTDAQKQIETVGSVFDLEAAARMCILDELMKSIDAMAYNIAVDTSPEGNGKLTLLAPWDYDDSMGRARYLTTFSATGWYATALSVSLGLRVNFLYVMLGTCGWFEDMLKDVWQENYDIIRALPDKILTEAYQYENAFARDWAKWGGPLNRTSTGTGAPHIEQTFQNHTDSAKYVYDWLTKRIIWMNLQLGNHFSD